MRCPRTLASRSCLDQAARSDRTGTVSPTDSARLSGPRCNSCRQSSRRSSRSASASRPSRERILRTVAIGIIAPRTGRRPESVADPLEIIVRGAKPRPVDGHQGRPLRRAACSGRIVQWDAEVDRVVDRTAFHLRDDERSPRRNVISSDSAPDIACDTRPVKLSSATPPGG